jgi:glutaredoxin
MEKYDPILSMSLTQVYEECDKIISLKSQRETKDKKREKWEIYTMEGCMFCEKAKKLLQNRKDKYDNIKVNTIVGIDENGNEDRDLIIKLKKQGKSDYSTWPRIFLNNEFIGGFSDLEKLLKKMK